jgi:AsmA family protein
MLALQSKFARQVFRFTIAAVVLVLLVAAVAETLGWPFLARPLESQLMRAMNRTVTLSKDNFKIRFLGSVRVEIGELMMASPSWSTAPFMAKAEAVKLTLSYPDLWAAYKGGQVNIVALSALKLTSHLERNADGRVSWQLRETTNSPPPLPHFNRLEVFDGLLTYSDVQQRLGIDAEFSAAAADKALRAQGTGQYRGLPLKFSLTSSGTLPWESSEAGQPRVGLKASAIIGRAVLAFEGSTGDITALNDIRGQYTLKGPSLSAVGDPVGVTLPTTAAFNVSGVVVKKLDGWNVTVKDLSIGSSRLSGAFQFNKKSDRNTLSGRLNGAKLKLADLGPAIGGGDTDKKGKVLPNRPFDLAALRVMDANVLIDIKEVDLNTTLLEPLRPLKAQLQLIAGILTISEIQANTAQGNLKGDVKLDGRGRQALWSAALSWDGLRLERWLKLTKKDGTAPYVTGKVNGSTKLKGEGKSTAEILASLQGNARTQIQNGSVSHLLVEAAGLDLAQALGVYIKGDDSLPIGCAIADLNVAKGLFTPKVLVVDTEDSAIWVEGNISLASEALNLKAVVAPKDFSPLALRSPILVKGTFSQPQVSIEKGALGLKIGGAVLLGLLNPLAALIPFIDFGDKEGAKAATESCTRLLKRAKPR